MVTKVYHAHIPKTAGTSLNSWLDDGVATERAKPDEFDGELVRWYKARGIPGFRSARTISASCWDLYDVIHGHRNLLQVRPPGSIVLTVLREPVARSISLFFDLAAHDDEKISHLDGATLAYRRDCIEFPFAHVREKWSNSPLFFGQHVDYMCRFFLRNEAPGKLFYDLDPHERFRRARAYVDSEVTAFGLTEQMDKSILHFSRTLARYPVSSLPRYNLGRPKTSEITADDRRYLESVTSADRMLWEHCVRRFEDLRIDYSLETFEAVNLKRALEAVVLTRSDDRFVYDMDAAFVGDGFWGRDSPGGDSCRRWSGPSDDSVLYLPWPHAGEAAVSLNIAGWMHRDARSSLAMKVWGEPVAASVSPGRDLADVVRFRARPRGGALKLEFHCAAKTGEEAESKESDTRRRGFSLHSITLQAA